MSAVSHMGGGKGEGSLVEAFYGSQHLDITTRSGDEVDDDACASVARGDCWCHAVKHNQTRPILNEYRTTDRCAYSSTAFGRSKIRDRRVKYVYAVMECNPYRSSIPMVLGTLLGS